MKPQKSLRQIAGDWHGGQWTALYAYSSTGTIIPGLLSEISECLKDATRQRDRKDLERLYNAIFIAPIPNDPT